MQSLAPPALGDVSADSDGASVLAFEHSATQPCASQALGCACDAREARYLGTTTEVATVVDPSAIQALHRVATVREVCMDNTELRAEPFDDLVPLVIAAPTWRPINLFSARPFSLFLRCPRDHGRGVILARDTSREVLVKLARSILADLSAMDPPLMAALVEPVVYDAIGSDTELLAAINEGDVVGVQNILCAITVATVCTENIGSLVGADALRSEDKSGTCPICFAGILHSDAAMRCCGEGGVHHYFHASCLQQWIGSCRTGVGATCPMCRGRIQVNGRRLVEFLQGDASAELNEEDRSFLQSIADGLQGKNSWSDMSALERTAYAGGIMAAVALGFTLGFTGRQHHVSNALIVSRLPREHQVCQSIGRVAGILAQIFRDLWRDTEREQERRRACLRSRHARSAY